MDAAIVTALPMELAPVTALWGVERPEPGVLYRGSRLDATEGPRRRLVALCTGPGIVSGALGLAELLRQVDPAVIVAGGIAGGVAGGIAGDAGVEPGDLVVAREVGFYGVDVTALGLAPGVLIRGTVAELKAPICPPRGMLENAFTVACNNGRTGKIHRGTILSGDCFLDRRLLEEFPPAWRARVSAAQAVDMESASWAGVAERAGLPWIVLRYISDEITGGERMPFPECCAVAGRILAAFANFFLPPQRGD